MYFTSGRSRATTWRRVFQLSSARVPASPRCPPTASGSFLAHRAFARLVRRKRGARRRVLHVRAGRRPRGRSRRGHQRHRGGRRPEGALGRNYRVGTLVHASRQLGVYTAAPTLFPRQRSHRATRSSARCSSTRPTARKNGVLLAKCRLLFIAGFVDRFAAKVIAELRGRLDERTLAVLGRPRAASSRWNTRPPITSRASGKSFIAELMPKASRLREPPAAGRARRHRRGASRHRARARCSKGGIPLRGLRRHLRRGTDGRVLPRQHPRGAAVAVDARDHRRGGSCSGQPHRRHPLARGQPRVRADFSRNRGRGAIPRGSHAPHAVRRGDAARDRGDLVRAVPPSPADR